MSAPRTYDPQRYPRPLGALRLELAPKFGRVEPCGLWWPYSRDLLREAAHLIDDFPAARGRVDRLVYAPEDWDVVATEVFTSRGRVKVGFLAPERGGGIVLLRLSSAGIIRLRVAWADPGWRMRPR